MDTITVQTETASLERSENQSTTVFIFFDFGNYQFPEKGWNDVIVVVLCWWLFSLKNLMRSLLSSIQVFLLMRLVTFLYMKLQVEAEVCEVGKLNLKYTTL